MTDKVEKKPYWREVVINKETKEPQRWNYRSEFVNRLGLDKSHGRIWLSFGLISLIGFTGFVLVKSQVIRDRRDQMKERAASRQLLATGK